MPRIEIPTTVTFYVQWILHPFATPQVPKQKSANSKWALAQTKKILDDNFVDSEDVKIAILFNGAVRLEIANPDMESKDGKEFWEEVLDLLKKSKDIESISVDVNNDISDKIAANLADRVLPPWFKGYQGYGNVTLIYHQ